MYAIFQMAGFQYRAEEGAVLKVPLNPAASGSKLQIAEVLLVKAENGTHVGTPYVAGARIEAEVMEHGKGEKVLGYKYKRRTKYRLTLGHRQDFTEIKIQKIVSPKS